MTLPGPRPRVSVLLCAFWSVGVLFGLYQIALYSSTPGQQRPQPQMWPAQTGFMRATDRPTMLLTLHPRCVCSKATVEELSRLMEEVTRPLDTIVLLYHPPGGSAAWENTDLARQIRTLPGVVVRSDPGGAESARLGMTVSGHLAFYGSDGRLLFSGGITPARGHEGDSEGRRALQALIAGGKPTTAATPVFGCSIEDGK